MKKQDGWKPNYLSSSSTSAWWQKVTGTFADNSAYDEAMQLGREYRESLQLNSIEVQSI
ncbi:MAG TPA: hypothetical protein V6D25_02550 [Leptolyngbyaceae cyanobacterium]